MLFDLRGKRRRVIQGIYLALAVLMGGGLVLFGIGGNVGGGLFDAITGNNSSSTGPSITSQDEKRNEDAVKRNPADAAAWAALARLRYQDATVGDNVDQTTGTFTAKGKAVLRGSDAAWQRYL